jgi:hypothetical protein
MTEVSPDDLKKTVERLYGGSAEFIRTVPVKEEFQGKVTWEGVVYVFHLIDNAKATRAYAWSSPIDGGSNRRLFTMLHIGGIRSPQDAVRAAMIAENRAALIEPRRSH